MFAFLLTRIGRWFERGEQRVDHDFGHVRRIEVLAQRPSVPFFEVHSENYYVGGGPALASLARIRPGRLGPDYPRPAPRRL